MQQNKRTSEPCFARSAPRPWLPAQTLSLQLLAPAPNCEIRSLVRCRAGWYLLGILQYDLKVSKTILLAIAKRSWLICSSRSSCVKRDSVWFDVIIFSLKSNYSTPLLPLIKRQIFPSFLRTLSKAVFLTFASLRCRNLCTALVGLAHVDSRNSVVSKYDQ